MLWGDIMVLQGCCYLIQIFTDDANMQTHKLTVLPQSDTGAGDSLNRTSAAAIIMNPASAAAQFGFILYKPGKILHRNVGRAVSSYGADGVLRRQVSAGVDHTTHNVIVSCQLDTDSQENL